MAKRVTVSLKDYDGDVIQTSFRGGDSTTDVTFAADSAAAIALRDAVLNITMGTQVTYEFGAVWNFNGQANPPATPVAQTNIQWVVEYVDNVNGRVFTQRIGTADLTIANVLKPISNEADLNVPEMAAFKTAFEAWVISEDGNPVTVNSIYFREK